MCGFNKNVGFCCLYFKLMQKIRFIFLTTFFSLAVFAFWGGEPGELYSPIEELAEEVEAGFYPLLKDVEDDVAYIKNTRRGSTNSNDSICQKSFYQFSTSVLLKLEKNRKGSYNKDFHLCQSEEISFLHRFQLF